MGYCLLVVLLIVWVVGGDSVAEVLVAEVGVYLGGGEAFVSQHFLHSTEVGTVLHQFGSETVTEAVGRDIFVQASLIDSLFDKLEDSNAREMVTAKIEEYIFFFAWLRGELTADGEDVVLQ